MDVTELYTTVKKMFPYAGDIVVKQQMATYYERWHKGYAILIDVYSDFFSTAGDKEHNDKIYVLAHAESDTPEGAIEALVASAENVENERRSNGTELG